jgi:PIN domain nuclease of toxin-antitoxin system
MRVLLDTHAFLWWFSDDPALTPSARKCISEVRNEVMVSAASAWELATKVRLGKLPTAIDLASQFVVRVEEERFSLLSITADHAVRAGLLSGPYRDPFDRMLIAQALARDLTIVTHDRAFAPYTVPIVWA